MGANPDSLKVDQLPAVMEDSEDSRPAGRLRGILGLTCAVLRGANRLSWLDREVYSQTLILHQMLVGDESDGEPATLEVAAGSFKWRSEEVSDFSPGVHQLHGMARRKGIRSITFKPEMSPRELMELLRHLVSKTNLLTKEELEKLPNVDIGNEYGIGSMVVPEVKVESKVGRRLSEAGRSADQVKEMVAEITDAIDAISPSQGGEKGEGSVEGDRPSDRSVIAELMGDMTSKEVVTFCLASLRKHDAYTYDHSVNVALLSISLARHIGWQGRDLHEFGEAALIHDLGKLYTPLEVLNKKGRFTPQEWAVMKRHPADGAEIIRQAGVSNSLAPKIAIEHHINFDGTGYPVLGYDQIHKGSRIVIIADVYDALTTVRPYRSQARPYEVLKMIKKQAGTHFDPELVDAFVDLMGVYPIGSVVKLKSGDIGLVVEVNAKLPERPIVRVLQDERGRKPRKPVLIDLARRDTSTGGYVDTILECIDPVIRNVPIGRYI